MNRAAAVVTNRRKKEKKSIAGKSEGKQKKRRHNYAQCTNITCLTTGVHGFREGGHEQKKVRWALRQSSRRFLCFAHCGLGMENCTSALYLA